MEKHQLAQELRQRQYNAGILEKHVIDAVPDDEIIDSYITCSDCGEKQVTPRELRVAIELAASAEQFFVYCESLACARTAASMSVRNAGTARTRRKR